MKTMQKKKTLLTLSLVWLAVTVHAQQIPLYTTDFTGPNGSSPEDWVSIVGVTPIMDIYDNNYRFRRDETASSGAVRTAVYNGEGADTWSNYSVTTTFATSHENNWAGILARWDGTTAVTNPNVVGGYYGFVRFTGGNYVLRIQSGIQRSTDQGNATILNSVVIPEGIVDDGIYQLKFILEGANLSLFLYDSVGNEITSVTAVDSAWTTGGAGVSAYMQGNDRQVLFHNFEVTAIPEPEHVVAGVGGLLLIVLLYYRRRLRAEV